MGLFPLERTDGKQIASTTGHARHAKTGLFFSNNAVGKLQVQSAVPVDEKSRFQILKRAPNCEEREKESTC